MKTFIRQISNLLPIKVIDAAISTASYTPIDISNQNKELQNFDVSSSKDWERYVQDFLLKRGAEVAFGGYLEVRDLYNRSTYFRGEAAQRNIHLGVDLWVKANTAVLAALDGRVHSYQNNTNHGDYGPTIILEHSIANTSFYTLYGHLSLASIQNIEKGQKVMQGTVIGYLGEASVNGDYAPHLHFQIILDMQHYYGDYPGVCTKKELPFYKKNCPDPNLLLKINH